MTINNNNIFGAFTLNEARGSRLTGDWLNKESVANYGWFGGGGTATVDRIDFSNDSVSALARGPLSSPAGRSALAATGNSNYGWFGGGSTPTPSTFATVDRIDFSNDSAAALARGPLSLARRTFASTGNSNYGWFGGGRFDFSEEYSTVDRIDFSNDAATVSVRGPLSSARRSHASTGNSNYGWFGSGIDPEGLVATVDRIDFSNDSTTASPRGPLSSARLALAATGNSNYGWFGAGVVFPGSYNRSTVDRIDFSNDSVSALARGSLSFARSSLAATGNSDYGWFGGGDDGGTPGKTATVDRINFSNDTSTASPRGALSIARHDLAATSGVLNIRRQKAGNYGWFGGGLVPSPVAVVATVDRIDFSNDTLSASPRGVLSLARRNLAATGNSNYGWFGSGGTMVLGANQIHTATIDRIDFSNDSPAGASVRGSLTSARYQGTATGNSNYGWFGGGRIPASPNPPSPILTVDRINFANDSTGTLVRGPLSSARYGLAATGNSNYGWFGGGYITSPATHYSTVDRIDFSNDLGSISIRSPLSAAKYMLAATGNSNYGWFGGGIFYPVPVYATVDRIDFANDSTTISVRGPLSQQRKWLTATGNSNYGWFGGGSDNSGVEMSKVERIDFSNDLASTSIRGSLNSSKRNPAAVSNTHIG